MSKKLLKLIPTHIRITKNVTYEVLWVEGFKDETQLGECRADTKQILLKSNQSPTETYKTYIHEVLHSLSFETEGLNLTETQVQLLEQSIYKMFKLNKVI